MTLRDGLGIIHTITRRETPRRFGTLTCGTSYTVDVRLSNVGQLLGKPTREMPTCVRCLARLFQ